MDTTESNSELSEQEFVEVREKMVEAAREGSISHLQKLAKSWQLLPDPLGDGIQSVFFHHLNSSDPPTNPNADLSNKNRAEGGTNSDLPSEYLKAFWSLYALAQIGRKHSLVGGRYAPEIIEAWPGIFKWSVFFLARGQPSNAFYENDPNKLRSTRDVVSRAWASLSWPASVRDLMFKTRGVSDIAAMLWVLEDGEDEDTVSYELLQIGSFLLGILTSSSDARENVVDRVMKAAGGIAARVARTAFIRLENGFKSQIFLFDQVYCMTLFTLIIQLSKAPNPGIHKAMLKHGAVVVSVNLLIRLASVVNQEYPKGAKVDHATRLLLLASIFIRDSLESGNGVTFIIQALNAGLLTAFVECSPLYKDIRDQEYLTVSEPISQIFPKYLGYLKVLQATDIALQQLERTNQFFSLRKTKGWKDFNDLALLTGERLGVLDHAKDVKKNDSMCCNNQCGKPDVRTNFRKCSRCRIAIYCSKECQVADWKDGHKQVCIPKAEQRLKEGELPLRDDHYMQAVNFRVAFKSVSYIKALAAKEHPRVPLEDIIVIINFRDDVPPSITLAVRTEWARQKPEILEWPKDTSLIFGLVPNGEGNPRSVLTPVPGGIWQLENISSPKAERIDREAEAKRKKYCGL